MGKLFVVGVGSGNYEDLTIRAERILQKSDLIYCDEKMFEKFSKYFSNNNLISNSYTATLQRCRNAIKSAEENKIVSILGSGDTGVYGISSIILEENISSNVDVQIIPGITSALSGAAILGSPLTQDFSIVSLSDNLADINNLENKIISLAKLDIGIVFYSPCNPTLSNLKKARDILLNYRSNDTIVGIVNNIGSTNQYFKITNLLYMLEEDINSFTTIFVGGNKTYIKDNKIITRLY